MPFQANNAVPQRLEAAFTMRTIHDMLLQLLQLLSICTLLLVLWLLKLWPCLPRPVQPETTLEQLSSGSGALSASRSGETREIGKL